MAVTDADGEVTAKYNYSPYGELLEGEYDENIPFLYNGQFGVMTDGNGLYYMRARYYNVDIKRFINQDVLVGTLERISSLNRFAYVEGNPISYLDPFGLDKWIYEEAHKSVAHIVLLGTIFTTILSVVFPHYAIGIAIGTFVASFCFDLGVYLAEMTDVGVTKEEWKTFARTTVENFIMLLLGLVKGVSMGVDVFEKAAAIIKAAIDTDKTLYPEYY